MKKILGFALGTLFLAGCQSSQSVPAPTASLGMANPASVYCVEQGGKLEIRNETAGQVGYCHLPDGQVVEEWALFRAHQPKCKPEQAQALVGQKLMSEAEIKTLSNALVTRVVAPNQPVTMDYREDRITLLVNPTTQIIESASCG